MIKTNNDILYNRLKNVVGFDKSPDHIKWLKDKFPMLEHHHLFGSYSQSKKTSDYCRIPVGREQHERAEKDKSNFAIDHLHILIKILIERIKYLESKRNKVNHM